MEDESKTKQVLIAELAAARQQVADLKAARSELQSVEGALRKSEERFRVALQNSKLVVYNQDLDLRYTWIYNPQLGFTPEGILGKTDADLLLPEDAIPLEKIKRHVLQTGVGQRETVRTIIDGKAYYYDLTVEPLRDEAGAVVGVTGASRDITERRQVELALQEQSHALAERVKELNCLYGMSRLREKPAVSLEEILQGTVDLIPPAWQYPELTAARVIVDDHEFVTQNYQQDAPCHLSTEIVVHGQVSGKLQVCYLETPQSAAGDDGDPFLKEESSLLKAIAERLGRITEHMRAEQEHQTILRTAIDGFWLCDTQGRILDVNDALCHMLGYTREELLALTIPDVEAAESPEEVMRHVTTIVDRGYDRFELRLRSKDGQFIDVEASVSYLGAVGGRFFAFLRDITERKWAEKLLQRARDDLELRVEERAAELHRGHQREQVLNALLRLSMEDISLDQQLERVLDELLSIPWLPVQPQGGIFLMSGDAPSGLPVLEMRAQRGLSPGVQVICARVDFGQCLCGRAAATQEVLFSAAVDQRHEIHYEGMEPHGHYCVPILSGNRSIGTIVLYLEPGHTRDLQQEEFLRSVGHTLAGIIERKRVEDALRRSEAGLAEAQRIAHLGNWDWDIGANRLHWSDEIYRIFGLVPQEFGATYEAFLNSVHPDDRDLVQRSVDNALYRQEPYSIDHRIVRPDGLERVVHEQAETTLGPSGQPVRMVGTVQDVTERKQAEVALQQSEQRLRELNEQLEDYGRELEKRVAERTREIERRRQVAESLREMLAVLNSDRPLDEILGYIVLVARRLLGGDTSAIYRTTGPDEEFEVQTVDGLHADMVSPLQFPPGYRRALQDGQPIAVSDAALAFPDLAASGVADGALLEDLAGQHPSVLAVPLIVEDVVYGGLVLYYYEPRVFSGEDVELAVAFADQAALAIENARLQQQAEAAAVLEERDRLARDLHDSVIQSLYSITLLAEGWKRLDKAGKLEDAEDPLGELGEIAQQALKEMRLLVHELRPPDLEEVGLLGALHLRLGAVEKRAGVDARLVAGDVMDLAPAVEEGLYRIAIEALNNALKHASATEVTVTLDPTDEGVVLGVFDNGCGFDAIRMAERRGVGLASMQERAGAMGGTLTIESAPGQGTRVRVMVGSRGNL